MYISALTLTSRSIEIVSPPSVFNSRKTPSGFFTVMAVWTPTPASEANFNVGDEIISANGLSTSEMTQEDLSRQLYGEPGREVQVGASSHGNRRTVRLAIRNLLCQ